MSLSRLGCPALFTASFLANAADEVQTARGQVVRADADANRVTVRTAAGKEVSLAVTPESKVGTAAKPTTLKQLTAGRKVRVTYQTRDGTDRLLTLVPAVTTDEDLGREVREALKAAKDYSFRQKDKYERELREVVDKVDDRIEDLRDRAKEAGADARAKIEEQVEELKKKRDALADRLGRAAPAAEDAWEDLKSGVGGAVEDLGQALDRFRSPPK
ncbi:MAG: hypothetical protein C0501_30970 [Isosphaera sp.]|nr:hypothetical protein [Isosphaera sp.]